MELHPLPKAKSELVLPRAHNGWQTHYTSNAGWLLCSMLGLYPVPAPPGQFIISSPAVTSAVIHNGQHTLTLQTRNNSGDNIYVRSIQVDGKTYPCYMIPAQRLAAGARIVLEMGDDPAQGLGDLYVGSADGLIRSAELVSASHLKYSIEAAATDATAKVHSRTRPVKVMVNGQEDKNWAYDAAERTATVRSAGTAAVEVWSK
jgi:hypothetical protein